MKKIIALVIALLMLFIISGCRQDDYEPQKSTEEESAVIYTLTAEGKKYEVKHELYRALFLNYKGEVDGGDSTVWSGENKDEYVARINEIILERASSIYSVIHLSDKLGLGPYSSETEEKITEYIRLSVDGNGADVVGFEGDYEAYLASLTEMNVNYSVQVLLLRYTLMLEKLNEYYVGTEDAALGHLDGEFEYTKEDVKKYYDSDECARVLQGFIQRDAVEGSLDRAKSLKYTVENSSTDINAALAIINTTTATPTDLIVDGKVAGIIIGKSTVTEPTYKSYTEALFALEDGQVSDIIEISGVDPGYFVIYRLEKTDEHFEREYDKVKLSYLNNKVGEELKNIEDSLTEDVNYSTNFEELSHADISMK